MIGYEFQKVPLRHQRDEFAMHGQVLEVADDQVVISYLQRQFPHRRMRKFEELVEQSEFVHHFERRRMDGVAPEIAQEILVLLEHDDGHALARQEEAKHHPGGAAAGDAASGFDLSHGWLLAS